MLLTLFDPVVKDTLTVQVPWSPRGKCKSMMLRVKFACVFCVHVQSGQGYCEWKTIIDC